MLSTRASAPIPVVFPEEGVFVLESRHRRGFRMDDTEHDFPKVLLAFQGSGYLWKGIHRHPIKAGDVAVVPAGTVHRLEDSQEAPLSLYGICIRPDFFGQKVIGSLGNIRIFYHPLWAGELSMLLRSLLIEESRSLTGREALITGLAWQIVGLIMRADGEGGTAALASASRQELSRQRVNAYVRELPRNFHKETDVDTAAARVGLSRRRFTQLFRDVAGQSWLQMLRELRIRHARKLLKETSRSVAAIAFEAGFSDLSHFYRVFRETGDGRSPEIWRKRGKTRN